MPFLANDAHEYPLFRRPNPLFRKGYRPRKWTEQIQPGCATDESRYCFQSMCMVMSVAFQSAQIFARAIFLPSLGKNELG